MSLAHGVLMPGFGGTSLPAWVERALVDGLAGVVLFAENVPDVATARALTDAVRAARPGAVVASDEEGGDVTRIQSATGSSIPGNAALGVIDDVTVTERVAEAYGRLIALGGIDLALAPCLDVASEPLNPVIGVRSFGASADRVGAHGLAFVRGLASAGVASCGKHFPGHGATTVDSHVGLPVLDVAPDLLRHRDQRPFAEAAPDAIMTAHVVVPAAGPEPATLSAWAYRDIRSLGHEGPVLTDALGMRAIANQHDIGEACVLALAAGADLLLLDAPHLRDPEADFRHAVTAIEAALTEGRLDAGALRHSAARNARLARSRPHFDDAGAADALETLDALGERVAREALRTRGDVALRARPVVVDVRRRRDHASGSQHDPLGRAFAAAGFDVAVARAGDPLPDDLHPVVLTRHPLGDDDEALALAAVLSARPDAIVVHGGVAEAAPEAERIVCMHGVGAVNARAAVRLMGGARS